MKKNKEVVRIELTTTQKGQLKAATGRDAEAIELTAQELEERMTPRIVNNHNETLLASSSD